MVNGMDELISVIIPVYNMEKYVEQCVKSVLEQTYKKIEVIIVDDGSNDGSHAICEKFVMDPRVQLYKKKNGGLSDARNYGMERATGEWLYFLDSDDWLKRDTLEILLLEAKKHNAEIAIGKFILTSDRQQTVDGIEKITVYSREETLAEMCKGVRFEFQACNKLIKRSLCNEIAFPVGKYYEDIYTTYKFIERAKKICYCENAVYYYFQRADSIVNEKFSMKKMDWISANESFLEYCCDKYPSNVKYAKCSLVFACISLINMIYKADQVQTYERELKFLVDLIKENKEVLDSGIESRCTTKKYRIGIKLLLWNQKIYGKLIQKVLK